MPPELANALSLQAYRLAGKIILRHRVEAAHADHAQPAEPAPVTM
jgi:hypothetical protein